ncbi:hypothetical protein [Actinomadura formosensis]|uniref:hypothetical protein n=1 Tax=Actinomadura formosensis TaxID=60706 RepID=UPI000B06ACC9|nr:hypothetical protein [Actinomadura formosensis]
MIKKIAATVLTAAALSFAAAGVASAADSGQPGPGSKQCIPGQQGNPHPGFKAGVCTNP